MGELVEWVSEERRRCLDMLTIIIIHVAIVTSAAVVDPIQT
jgi:hypothetical protein